MKLPELPPLPTAWVFPYPDREMFSKEQLKFYATTYAEAAVKAEREACARLCYDRAWSRMQTPMLGPELNCTELGHAIRARSKE